MVVDTSALFAVVLEEPEAANCETVLKAAPKILISAGTMAEALVVANRRGLSAELMAIITGLGLQVEPVTAATARLVGLAHARWGKGVDPAGLNFGDCFSYALATERGLPLLYVGGDFSKTDVVAALG